MFKCSQLRSWLRQFVPLCCVCFAVSAEAQASFAKQISTVGPSELPFTSGNWTATNKDGKFADAGTSGQKTIAVVICAKTGHFQLELSGFQVPMLTGTTIAFQASFDDGKLMSFSGNSDGSSILANLADSDVAEWTHEMTAEHRITISFTNLQESNGDPEPMWSIPLTGTSATITALAEALSTAGVRDLPAPWNTSASTPVNISADEPGDDTTSTIQPDSSNGNNTQSTSQVTANPSDIQDQIQSPEASNSGQQLPSGSANSEDQSLTFSDPQGVAYANLGETTWTKKSTTDEMTDSTDVTVVSEQQNGSGATAEVTGSCSKDVVTFSALIAVQPGQAVLKLPNEELAAPNPAFPSLDTVYSITGAIASVNGEIRINSYDPTPNSFLVFEYLNNVQIAQLSLGGSSADDFGAGLKFDLASTWRIMAEFDTDYGRLIVRIPLYDPQIESFVDACVANEIRPASSRLMGYLGISAKDISPQMALAMGLPTDSPTNDGVLISSVVPNGPASNAGLLPNDVIKNIDGVVMSSSKELSSLISSIPPGQSVTVTYLRNGESQSASVVLTSRPTVLPVPQ